MKSKTAVVLGCKGQDGSLMCRSLLEKNYKVIGLIRGELKDESNLHKLDIKNKIKIETGDIKDFQIISNLIEKYQPDCVYNLAAQSSVGQSFQNPKETIDSIVNGTMNILNVCKIINYTGRIFFAGSSEMFGNIESKANIDHPQQPNSPYAIAKQTSFNLVKMYREIYALKCTTGILFNHESNLRPETFVTQKIIKTAQEIKKYKKKKLIIGNIDIIRDWGWAPEYINAIQLISNSNLIKDHIVCTGKATSLKTFIQKVFAKLDLDWEEFTVVNKNLFRASDIKRSCGDPTPLFEELGWKSKVNFDSVIERMLNQ
ncbi:GDP-D-mannose dehydratase [Prochlorococcus marinus str. NATL2A]|uniref:GDP-mannose 4,6-dehydratase n=1 Tax=Prochlorococcus marinus (strain NATL2A) TaxID=59920 RepID=Q46IG0_PROMT|nr:GDP-mannose 4,6-dehydratase [Prochlorococcus marinus]AAZ58718.1 GDP-D-mannose dehydratase [Prochlorococcus marinus str. NATL2A]